MNRDQVPAELQALKLTSGQYVAVGGAAFAIRDIRYTEDIDLVVTPQLFDVMARGWQPKARPSGKPGLKFARAEAYLDVNCEAFGRSASWMLEHAERVHDTLLVDLPIENHHSWRCVSAALHPAVALCGCSDRADAGLSVRFASPGRVRNISNAKCGAARRTLKSLLGSSHSPLTRRGTEPTITPLLAPCCRTPIPV